VFNRKKSAASPKITLQQDQNQRGETFSSKGSYKEAQFTDEDSRKPSAAKKRHEHNVKMMTRIASASVAVAIAAVAYGSYSVITTSQDRAILEAQTSKVVTTTQPIAANTKISADMLSIQSVPNQIVPAGSFSSVDDAVGKITSSSVSQNAVITDSSISGSSSAATLAAKLDPGTVGVTIAVGTESGLAGMIHQGDMVDVYGVTSGSGGATYTDVLLSNAPVVALDSSLSTASSGYSSVTVQASAQQAANIITAQSNGKVSCILHSAAEE
jgi:pilus assembly protein CpaB